MCKGYKVTKFGAICEWMHGYLFAEGSPWQYMAKEDIKVLEGTWIEKLLDMIPW